jgi:F0F1-type ATP synthase epsilon subunit
MTQAPSGQLMVNARAPFNVYFQGSARSLSAANRVGPFDVLPGHADFFSILEPGEVVIEGDDGPTAFTIDNGIITVRDDEVLLFVNV